MVTYYRNSPNKKHYRLCYGDAVIPTNEVKYIPVDFKIDADTFHHAYRVVCGFHGEFTSIKFVREAYDEFIDQIKKMSAPSDAGDRILERRARSFFVEFEVFLTHWERYIKHTGNKKFLDLFTNTIHDAYDSSDDYALATMLRNYLTHSSNVIQGHFWGGGIFDVGCNKDALLNDSFFTNTKKEIIKRQPTQFISLKSIMKGALKKIEDVYRILIEYDAKADKDFISSGARVSELIEKIKDNGRRFYFVDTYRDAVYSDQGIPGHSEIVGYGQYIEEFKWKDYEEDIEYLVGLLNNNSHIKLTLEEEKELNDLRSLPEEDLKVEATSDPDCPPLAN